MITTPVRRAWRAALLAVAACFVLLIAAPGAVSEQASSGARPAQAGYLDAGDEHSCAILADRSLRCWGKGLAGRLGYGNEQNVLSGAAAPAVDLGPGRTPRAVAAGDYHTCAILDDGSVRCWGFGANGRLGYGQHGQRASPASAPAVDLGPGAARRRSRPARRTRARSWTNGAVRCWGNGGPGRLGYGNQLTVGDNETPAAAGPVDIGRAGGRRDLGRRLPHLRDPRRRRAAVLGLRLRRPARLRRHRRRRRRRDAALRGRPRPGRPRRARHLGRQGPHLRGPRRRHRPLLGLRRRRPPRLRLGRPPSRRRVGPGRPRPGTHRGGDLRGRGARLRGARQRRGPLLGIRRQRPPGLRLDHPIGDDPGTPRAPARSRRGRPHRAGHHGGLLPDTCALLDDGTLRCWGFGGSGRLGYGSEDTTVDDTGPSLAAAGPVPLGAGRRSWPT